MIEAPDNCVARRPTVGHRDPALRIGLCVLLCLGFLCLLVPSAQAGGLTAARRDPTGYSAAGSGTGRSAPATTGVTSITAASPWVESDGEFVVDLAPSNAIPPDAEFTYTIHQRLSPGELRESLEEISAGAEPSGNLHGPTEFPVLLLGNPADGMRLRIPIRSTSGAQDRLLVPTPGIHPVSLSIETATGEPIWSEIVFLNRLPIEDPVGRDGEPARTAVQVIAELDSEPVLTVDGGVDLDATTRAAISSVQSLLEDSADLPLTVNLRPNTLLGLGLTGDLRDQEFVEQIKDTDWTLARQSYVETDAASLTATGRSELARQVLEGDSVLAAQGELDTSQWLLDDTVDTEAARALAAMGVKHLIMSESAFTPVAGGPEQTTGRAYAVQDVEGLIVSAYDPYLIRILSEAGTEPALKAHESTTAMMASWFEAISDPDDSFPGAAASILVPPGTEPETLRALLEPLTRDGPLRAAPPVSSANNRGIPVVAALHARETANMEAVVDRTESARRSIDGFRSMTSEDNPSARQWDLVNNQAPSSGSDSAERAAIWSGVDSGIQSELAGITGPDERTVVLTSGSGTIPVRIRNDMDTEVRLLMQLRSPRLEFPEGNESVIVLPPGDSRVDVAVEVRAPGSSLLRIELSSPDGVLTLPGAVVPVRSSSISGVGAALSVLSLLFLLLWWFRTHRRSRSEAAAGHPSSGSSG